VELHIEDPRRREAVSRIAGLVAGQGGRALLVGGSVRDAALGRAIQDVDVDLEVFGIEANRLEALLREHFACRSVGSAFPVLKLDGLRIDVAVPASPGLSFEAASARRDFTFNAMGIDPRDGGFLDPHGGSRDLERGILRHTSQHFAEDPLRVLRGMQLVARFDLTPAPATVTLCRTLSPEGLPAERIFEEWRKLILLGERIGQGLRFLEACSWLPHFPELAELVGCPQDPRWHPEGDVWVHTGHCLDAYASERTGDDREDLVVGLAVLCHDLGKPATTREEEGRITSKGHESLGEELS
jgi:tRNA nucleotidyltransferase (CCA-adding enzyme)